MPTPRYKYRFQLQDRPLGVFAGPPITNSGGMVLVAVAATCAKATLTQKDGTSQTNPVPLTRGSAEFYSTSANVDLFIMCPDGQFVVLWNVGPDALFDVPVNRGSPNQCLILPILGSDYTAATEVDTGIDVPSKALILPDIGFSGRVAQAKTMDVGLLSSESGGDADGFLVGISFNGTVLIAAKSAATATRGALVGAGTLDRGHATDSVTSKSLSVTTASATTTGAGYIFMPYVNLPHDIPVITP